MIVLQLMVVLTRILLVQSKVLVLDQSNLKQFTHDSAFYLVQIAKSKCKECESQEQELEAIGDVLQGAIKVAKVDHKYFPVEAKLERNPSYIFVRGSEADTIRLFQQAFDSTKLVLFAIEQLNNELDLRITAATDSQGKLTKTLSKPSKGSSGKTQQQKEQRKEKEKQARSATVIELTDDKFEEKVLKSKQAWLVAFYSPGCGHCRQMEPQYFKLPKLIGKQVHIARIDGTKHQKYMSKYQVKGFPTIFLFDNADKGKPVPYQGQRTAEDIVSWLKQQKIDQEQKQMLELTPESYSAECNRNFICLVFILDSKSDKNKIKYVREVMDETDKPVKFFYSKRLPELESALMIEDRSCPKTVAFWDGINAYRVYRGEQNEKDLKDFLSTLLQKKKWIKLSDPIPQMLFKQSQEL